jgi:hypothetical protein
MPDTREESMSLFHVEGAPKVVTKTLKIAIPDDQFAGFLERESTQVRTLKQPEVPELFASSCRIELAEQRGLSLFH